VLIYGAYVTTAILILTGVFPWHTAIVALTLPAAYNLVKLASTTEDPKVLHRVQGMTAQLHWRIGIALSAGLLAWVLNIILVTGGR
jgi:1,4-dihydroxy-2-naphthoate octaprenyltransferase